MLKQIEMLLRFFDGEGSSSGGESSATASTGVSAQVDGSSTDNGETEIDINAEFDSLIKDKYKEVYDSRIKETLDKRMKNHKANETKLVKQIESTQPLINKLATRYGILDGDLNKISEAIDNDSYYLEQEADKQGLTVEQLRKIREMEAQNEQYKRFQEEQQRTREANEIYTKLMQDAEMVKQTYPDFNIEEEVKNESFMRLLRSGFDMKLSYEMLHKDELQQRAIEQSKEQVINNIKARGNRPSENGTNNSVGRQTKIDFATMSTEEFKKYDEEIQKRLRNGERIESFM